MRRFDPLANAIAQELPVSDVILDGEIVVMSEGRPDFIFSLLPPAPIQRLSLRCSSARRT
jgi:hypothetical protein